MFDINNKVAIVTGGCNGIGFAIAESLLENGAKGVALFDVDEKRGLQIEEDYKKDNKKKLYTKLIFIKTDVTKLESIKNSFDITVDTFRQLDIVINNAGIINEVNAEKIVNLNITAVFHGCMLALDHYLPKYKTPNSEALIINTASITGLEPFAFVPMYSATKAAIVHYSRAIGKNYEQTNVKVITVCPGATRTGIIDPKTLGKVIKPEQLKPFVEYFTHAPEQSCEVLAMKVIEIIEKAESGSVWTIIKEENKLIDFPDLLQD